MQCLRGAPMLGLSWWSGDRESGNSRHGHMPYPLEGNR